MVARLGSEIRASSRNQKVPGLTASEVHAEMMVCLWRAQRTFRKSMQLTIEQYWWAIWMNRKADLIAWYFAAKRDLSREVLVAPDDMSRLEDEELVDALFPLVRSVDELILPGCPTKDPMARKVWALLAQGYTRKDILVVCEISKRTYYSIIEQWRKPLAWR